MTTAKSIYNPYPGLRPFSSTEGNLFFGRDSQSDLVLDKIQNNRLVALIGASGSGKSSLINAGIIHKIATSSKYDALSSWKVITTRPGTSPLASLSEALKENVSSGKSKEEEKSLPDNATKPSQIDPGSLAELLQQINRTEQKKILIVIDNFEELFRFGQNKANSGLDNEREDFVRFIVEVTKDISLPVHFLLAIRSGFLEDCQKLVALNHLITESSFNLPHLATEELKQVIQGPAAFWGAEIESGLEKQLVRDIVDKSDQLPLLQHILCRMWDYWLEQNVDQPISLKEYNALGGVENAISIHAEEAFMELTNGEQHLCEKIFKAITEKVSGNLEVGNPLSIREISNITRAGVPEIIKIVDRFRQSGRLFLLPHYESELDSETVIELSHESLIRIWLRLQTWVDEEAESVSMYLNLAEASRLYQMGKATLLSAPALNQALLWKEKNEPSYQWAQRHNTAFERTMQFLNRSHEEYELSEYKSYVKTKRAEKLARVLTFTAIVLVISSAGLVFFMSGALSGIIVRVEQVVQEILPGREQTGVPGDHPGTAESNDIIQEVPGETVVPPVEIQREPLTSVTQSRETPASETPSSDTPAIERELSTLPPPVQTPSREPSAASRETPATEEPSATPGTVPTEPVRPVIARDLPAVQNEISGLIDEEAGHAAIKGRMLAISQALAVRSLQVENNPDLKALLAFQSHIFNEKFNGSSYIPDIYTGLITSIQNLYGSDHNVYKGHSESVNSVVFRPNSDIFYSASSDGQVLQWDLNDTNKTPRELINNSVVNNMLAISPNGQWLAVATDGLGIKVFNHTRNSAGTYQIRWGDDRILTMDFYPDNEAILFAGSDNSIVRHNITSRSNEVIGKTSSEVLSLAISPDGTLIAAGTRSGQVILYRNQPNPAPRVIHEESGNDILSVAFNRNGSRIAAGTIRGEVKIINVEGNLLASLGGHTARVVDIAFCPDNKLLASASFDGSIRIWDAQNFNLQPVVIREHGSWARTVAFNSKGDKLATGSRLEARLRVWTTDANEMASMICGKLTRNMTQSEWNQYIGDDIPYMESCPQLTNR